MKKKIGPQIKKNVEKKLAAPLDLTYFMVEDPSWNRLASRAYFTKPATLSLVLLLTTVKYKNTITQKI